MISEEAFLETIKKSLNLKDIQAEDEFRDYEDWNSLAFITLVDLLEDSFGVETDPDFFSEIDTWRDLYKTLQH